MFSKPLILLNKKYFYLMFTWQMFISIIEVLSFYKTAFHKNNKHFRGHIYEQILFKKILGNS
jgi:hypothetical protein